MTSEERIAAGLKIAEMTGARVEANDCNYPITYETPADWGEECTDLVLVFDRGTGYPMVILPLDDWDVNHLLSQCK